MYAFILFIFFFIFGHLNDGTKGGLANMAKVRSIISSDQYKDNINYEKFNCNRSNIWQKLDNAINYLIDNFCISIDKSQQNSFCLAKCNTISV